jgi:protein-tyrosine phosphatase
MNPHYSVTVPQQYRLFPRRNRLRTGAYTAMNSILLFLFAAAVLRALVLPAAAQDQDAAPPPRAPERRLPSGRPRPNVSAPPARNLAPLLEALDINHDGVIDPEELASAATDLQMLDRNDDGQLTADEYSTSPAVTGSRAGPARFPSRFGPRPQTAPAPKGGLENFGMVDTHVFRGARPGALGIQTLKQLGVTSIIDLTLPDKLGEAERLEASRNGIDYFSFPMDPLAHPSPDQVATTLSMITNATERVFVHCQAGKDRTGTIVACYRIAHCGWTSEEALREANSFQMSPAAIPMREFIARFGRAPVPAEAQRPEGAK